MTDPTVRSLISSTIVAAMLCVSTPAFAAAPDGESSVLGLEGPDTETTQKLTDALRKAFSKRGVGGGQELPLVELKLTMGCEEDSIECLSEGGKTLGVSTLVYGTLRAASGGSYKLDMYVLDVNAGAIAKDVTVKISEEDLADDRIEQTAADAVAELYGEDPGEAPVAKVPATEATQSAPRVRDEPAPAKGKLVWGKQADTPTWKVAGLWTSVGLTVVSLGAAIGTTVMIRDGGPVYDDLIKEAENSLGDSKDSNDVDPNSDDDLCDLARSHPVGDPDPDTVTNAAVTKVCNKADGLALAATITWATTGVFAATTLLFAGLTYIHRDKPTSAALRRHKLAFGAGPTANGGVMFGGGFEF